MPVFSLGQHLKQLNTEARYFIDSFPVAVCDNVRICRSQLLEGEAYRGHSASKRRYFYGFKVQLLMTHDGLPVELYIHAGSEAEKPWTRNCPPAAYFMRMLRTPTMPWKMLGRRWGRSR